MSLWLLCWHLSSGPHGWQLTLSLSRWRTTHHPTVLLLWLFLSLHFGCMCVCSYLRCWHSSHTSSLSLPGSVWGDTVWNYPYHIPSFTHHSVILWEFLTRWPLLAWEYSCKHKNPQAPLQGAYNLTGDTQWLNNYTTKWIITNHDSCYGRRECTA